MPTYCHALITLIPARANDQTNLLTYDLTLGGLDIMLDDVSEDIKTRFCFCQMKWRPLHPISIRSNF